jgi:hypothetical protein
MDHLILIIGGIVEAVVLLGGGILAYRKFGLERKEVSAEADSDYANAAKTLLESYTQLSALVTSRDVEYVELHRKVVELEIENAKTAGDLRKANLRIDELVCLDQQREIELNQERELRLAAEKKSSQLEKKVQELRTKITQLETAMAALKSKKET